MGRPAALFCLLLAGCSALELEQPRNPEVAPPAGADDAIDIVLGEWAERLGAGGYDAADLPPIYWFEGRCLDYGDKFPDDECVAGLTQYTPISEEIHLVVRDQIHSSLLAHELLHWSLNQTEGNRDGDHTGPMWEQLPDVKDVLKLAGL
jgi:hypothetical protein